jgi:hypothetical protein
LIKYNDVAISLISFEVKTITNTTVISKYFILLFPLQTNVEKNVAMDWQASRGAGATGAAALVA